MNEEYVSEILDGAQVGLAKASFYYHSSHDINAGYLAEVHEAWSRYRSQGLSARGKSKLDAKEAAE